MQLQNHFPKDFQASKEFYSLSYPFCNEHLTDLTKTYCTDNHYDNCMVLFCGWGVVGRQLGQSPIFDSLFFDDFSALNDAEM